MSAGSRIAAALTALFGLGSPGSAQIPPPHPQFEEVVITANPAIAPNLSATVAAFMADEPGMPVRVVPLGSDVAMAWLSTGRADIAVIGRDIADQEAKAFEWVFRAPPAVTHLALGSVATSGHSPALAVRVHADNSLRSITLDQLRALLRIVGDAPSWGELGVTGALAPRPVRVAMPGAESGTGRYLRKMLVGGRPQFAWDRVREFGKGDDAAVSAAIAAAVARDRTMIGLGDARPLAGTRIVTVGAGQPATAPEQAGYPLARNVLAYANPKPRERAAQFLAFAGSPTGLALLGASPFRPLEAPRTP